MTKPLFESEVKTPAEGESASLRTLCERRQRELTLALASLAPDGSPQTRKDIEMALAALDGLLTGNLDKIPPMVAVQLSKWIATSKYLGAKEMREVKGGARWPSS